MKVFPTGARLLSMPKVRLALVQSNPTVGDRDKNIKFLLEKAEEAHKLGTQILITGELALTGYPIEDLALRDNFLEISANSLESFAVQLKRRGLGDMAVIIGHPRKSIEDASSAAGSSLQATAQNCASVIAGGKIVATYAKQHLPNYAVFDEARTFVSGQKNLIIRAGGADFGIIVCEDLWLTEGPVTSLGEYPLSALLVPNASPFENDKDGVRELLVSKRAEDMNAFIVYVNLVGGQDDLVFDGDSMVVDSSGTRLAWGSRFEEDLIVTDLELAESPKNASVPAMTELVAVKVRSPGNSPIPKRKKNKKDSLAILWQALVTGTRDYVEKNKFPSVILGLSGGIDSAVCATIAADAVGPNRVFGVGLPSALSSDHSIEDARELSERQKIDFRIEPISDLVSVIEKQLGLQNLAYENLQARARAIVLMGLANKEGHLVLTTGNKSELAVGYSTIYGDSVGGYAPLKDVFKTLVWDLALWRNQFARETGTTPPIPERSITKPPSAELSPGQTDQDSLPPYATLDKILNRLILEGKDGPQIIEEGFDDETVNKIVRLVSRAEWKRRQSAIGPRISSIAFGRDRRLPITSSLSSFDNSR